MFKYYAFLIISVVFISCSSQEHKRNHIAKLEKQIFTDSLKSKIDVAKLNELLDAYQQYGKQYKDDTIVKIYLFSAAKLCMVANQHHRAIEFLTSIVSNYPTWAEAPEALFVKGFIYDNTLHDIVNARKAYEQLLKQYPQSEYADDAQGSIRILGKSTEEIINEFEQKGEMQ